jgi:ornithine--oxo-acid transaminase
VKALCDQAHTLCLTSRAFYNDVLGGYEKYMTEYFGYDRMLPMNTGAEAVETALKTARRWGVDVKGVPDGSQEIIVCENNFHGRTIAIISMSTDPSARRAYGPYTPGFKVVKYGDAAALEAAVTENTVAFLVEPIQAEAGVLMPPEGYLQAAREICAKHGILFIADEIQTGFARTGKMFACQHENVDPDIFVLGKALGGGIMPISAVAADKELLQLFEPGSHGSTFGGNPLACAVAIKALEILERDNYAEMSAQKGVYFMDKLLQIKNAEIVDIRGKGLFIGVEFSVNAAPYVKKLIEAGVLAKETQERTIRFAPPIIISYEQMEQACALIAQALSK